jgi:hypothetical protein
VRVVGIDQSYTGFGFCVDGESKKKSFPPGRYDSDVHRLAAIEDWFTQWLRLQKNAGIDLVVMEGYANNAKFGREIAGELGAVVKLATLYTVGHPPLIVPPNSLKKFVTGKGSGPKNVMIAHVYRQWNVMFSDDNQADAYALEKFGYAFLGLRDGVMGHMPTLKYQIEAVEAVLKGK